MGAPDEVRAVRLDVHSAGTVGDVGREGDKTRSGRLRLSQGRTRGHGAKPTYRFARAAEPKITASGSEPVDGGSDRRGGIVHLDDVRLLELPQPLREQVRRDAGQRFAQV